LCQINGKFMHLISAWNDDKARIEYKFAYSWMITLNWNSFDNNEIYRFVCYAWLGFNLTMPTIVWQSSDDDDDNDNDVIIEPTTKSSS